jgi:uncharacterized protein YlxW (UPF0749 family)
MNTKIITFSILAVLFMTIAGATSEIAPCFVLIIASTLACVFAATVFIVILCNEIKAVCDKKLQAKAVQDGQVADLETMKSELEKNVNKLKEDKVKLEAEIKALEGKDAIEEIKALKEKNAELIAQLEGMIQMGKRLSAVEKKLEAQQ